MNLPAHKRFKWYMEIKVINLTLLPTEGGGGGGGGVGPHHQTGSQNSRTLSPKVSKISDFFFMPFGHIVAKFQVDLSARGLVQSFFEQEVMKNKGLPNFFQEICFSGGKQTITKVSAAFIVKNCHPRTSSILIYGALHTGIFSSVDYLVLP